MNTEAILAIISAWAETPYATYGDLVRMIAKAKSHKGESK